MITQNFLSADSEIQEAQQAKKFAVKLAILFVVFFALLCIFSPYARGSDQYWYVGDVERVVLQDGLFRSNSIFPASLPDDVSKLPRPWVQNKPVSYIVLGITYLTQNGQFAWLILNSICLFLTAWFTAKALHIAKEKRMPLIAMFVFFPLNFYLATQALPEVFLMFLISLMVWLLLAAKKSTSNFVLLAFVAGFLICHRPNYILLLLLIPCIQFILFKKEAAKMAVIFVAISLATAYAGSLLLAEHLIRIPSIFDTVLNNVPGKTNMGNFLYEYDNTGISFPEIIQAVWYKFVGALVIQFEIVGMSGLMFYLINIMLIAVPVLILKKRHREPEFLVALVFIVIHFITIVLFYNQYRYAAAIIPSLFIVNVLMFRNIKMAVIGKSTIAYTISFGFAAVSMVIGYQVRKDAMAENEINIRIQQAARHFHAKAVMCEWNSGGCLSVAYAMNPKSIFYFPKDYSAVQWVATAQKLKAKHGIFYSQSALYKSLRPYIRNEIKIIGSNIIFFEIAFPVTGGVYKPL